LALALAEPSAGLLLDLGFRGRFCEEGWKELSGWIPNHPVFIHISSSARSIRASRP